MYIHYDRVRLAKGGVWLCYQFKTILEFNEFMDDNPAESLYWDNGNL
jgi:hypothetical protein